MSVKRRYYTLQDDVKSSDGVASAEISRDGGATWHPLTYNPDSGYWERRIELKLGDNKILHRATDKGDPPSTSKPIETIIRRVAR